MTPEPTTPKPAAGHIETITVDGPVVACDGGEGPLGHPRVWLRIVEKQIFCPYCSRLYVLAEGAAGRDGH